MRHDGLVVRDDDGVELARVHQPVQQAEQLLDVGEMESVVGSSRTVDVALLAHVTGQFESLSLAARERGERLAEAEVAKPDVGEPSRMACAAGVRASPAPKKSAASITDIASTSRLMSRPPRW